MLGEGALLVVGVLVQELRVHVVPLREQLGGRQNVRTQTRLLGVDARRFVCVAGQLRIGRRDVLNLSINLRICGLSSNLSPKVFDWVLSQQFLLDSLGADNSGGSSVAPVSAQFGVLLLARKV